MVWLNQKLIQKILSVSHKPGVVLSHVTIWACNECKASAKSWVGERNSSLLRYNGNIWCTLQMDIIIISVFQKCKETQLLAHEDGTQMFCSDDLYFFNVGFFFFPPLENYLFILQTCFGKVTYWKKRKIVSFLKSCWGFL